MKDINDAYMNTLVPMVVEQSARGERAYDFLKTLKRENYIYFRTYTRWDVNFSCSSATIFRSRIPKKRFMYINSPAV